MVTAKLICVFVFAYAKSRVSHDEAHITITLALFYTMKANMYSCERDNFLMKFVRGMDWRSGKRRGLWTEGILGRDLVGSLWP